MRLQFGPTASLIYQASAAPQSAGAGMARVYSPLAAAREIGQSIKGVRNSDYHHPGLPYLDGFVGIYADKQAVRVAALRSDRAAIEFRGFPPSVRDELVGALGSEITVQESDWNCGSLIEPNHKKSRLTMRACDAR